MNQTEEILTISGKEFKIILFSKEKVDFAVVPKFGDQEIRNMVLDEWEKKDNMEDERNILEQHIKFEVYSKDLGEHKWEDAKKLCKDLGNGWRLPTREELHLMWLNKESIGCSAAAYYWSSSEGHANYAWGQYFIGGSQYSFGKNSTYYVRAVRALSI